jgi:GTPase SAR1 family protein
VTQVSEATRSLDIGSSPFFAVDGDEDFYEGTAPQYNAFASPPQGGSKDVYPKMATAQAASPAPSAPASSQQQGGNLRGKTNKIKVSEPTDLPFVVDGLKKIYKNHLRPLEEKYKFGEFSSPLLRDSDFDAKPMVLLMGQYSVGKTSFIEYLLERPFPGSRIGPEPTTDRFVAVMEGEEERVIPGNALSVDDTKPFHALNRFGTAFLSKFEAAQCSAPILKHVTFIDTPGILSGEKQRIGRSYDFTAVVNWFAERCDLILLMFDAHKLDISDEFKSAIMQLRGHDDKIRVVLNKADRVNTQQLMRVYGALMWSLGKVVGSPETLRVYISSFWNEPYFDETNAELFMTEQADLLNDLQNLPRNSAVRKVNELVKRTRLAKAHAYVLGHLRDQMPAVFGKDAKKAELIQNLGEEFKKVMRMYRIPPGDFPEIDKMKLHLNDYDFSESFFCFFPRVYLTVFRKLSETGSEADGEAGAGVDARAAQADAGHLALQARRRHQQSL